MCFLVSRRWAQEENRAFSSHIPIKYIARVFFVFFIIKKMFWTHFFVLFLLPFGSVDAAVFVVMNPILYNEIYEPHKSQTSRLSQWIELDSNQRLYDDEMIFRRFYEIR